LSIIDISPKKSPGPRIFRMIAPVLVADEDLHLAGLDHVERVAHLALGEDHRVLGVRLLARDGAHDIELPVRELGEERHRLQRLRPLADHRAFGGWLHRL
jgi:hypothetical protein